MSKKITVALVGAGNRGKNVYAKYTKVFPDQIEIVAVADINPGKVQEVKEEYGLANDMCFNSADELLAKPRLADMIFLCTMDLDHYVPAIEAIKKGYHLLLEKPISPDLKDCKEIERLALLHNRHVLVCHVLRYAPLYQEMKKIITSGEIGKIVSIQANENIGYYHYAHSFARGNWRNSNSGSSMIMQKCCHDMDIFLWLTENHCKSISSFGSLTHFKTENAPLGSADRCLNCQHQKICPYDAEEIYINSEKSGIAKGVAEWASMFVLKPNPEKVREALKTNEFGRCVYKCDNNVADHQIVNAFMEDEITISFHVCALTNSMGRMMHICGTKGDLISNSDEQTITVQQFGKEPRVINVSEICCDLSGHGGGDRKLIEDVIRIIGDENADVCGLTEITRSVESHYMAVAAEKSRLENGKTINLDVFINEVNR